MGTMITRKRFENGTVVLLNGRPEYFIANHRYSGTEECGIYRITGGDPFTGQMHCNRINAEEHGRTEDESYSILLAEILRRLH